MVLISKEQLERIQREGGVSGSNNTATANSANTANTSTATFAPHVLQTTTQPSLSQQTKVQNWRLCTHKSRKKRV